MPELIRIQFRDAEDFHYLIGSSLPIFHAPDAHYDTNGTLMYKRLLPANSKSINKDGFILMSKPDELVPHAMMDKNNVHIKCYVLRCAYASVHHFRFEVVDGADTVLIRMIRTACHMVTERTYRF